MHFLSFIESLYETFSGIIQAKLDVLWFAYVFGSGTFDVIYTAAIDLGKRALLLSYLIIFSEWIDIAFSQESGENTQEAQHAIKREFYDTISVDSNSQYSDIHDGNASSVPSQEDNESSVGILKRRNTSKNGIPKFVDEFISQDNDNRQGQEVGTTSDDPLVKIPRLSVLNEHADHADDYFQTFGKYVASELRSLQSTENRNKLRRMIQKAIFEVGELDDAAAIN